MEEDFDDIELGDGNFTPEYSIGDRDSYGTILWEDFDCIVLGDRSFTPDYLVEDYDEKEDEFSIDFIKAIYDTMLLVKHSPLKTKLKKGSSLKTNEKKPKREHTKYFENGTRHDWHHCKAFKEYVLKFSEQFARQPNMKEANEMHTKIMKQVEERMKDVKIFSRLEFVGSAYEGVKVTDLEFDIMVIMKVPSLVKEQIEGRPNFALLKPEKDSKQQLAEFLGSNGYISSSKVTDFFFKYLQICCNNLVEKTLLRKHGPAIQMDVYNNEGQFFYSVDIVPTVTVHEELYVAKQLKTVPSHKMDLTWRKTFSLDEKKLLENIDLNHGCRKQVLRIVKAIRNAEPSLHKVSSYVLKNVVLKVHEKLKPTTVRTDKKDPWNNNNIGSRLMDVFRQLKEEFNAGYVPCYFDSRINLIEDLKPITINNIRDRFRHLLNSYKQMKKVLKADKPKGTGHELRVDDDDDDD